MKTNATLQQQQKEMAISLLKQLGIYQPYIDGFEKDDTVCFFEHYTDYPIDYQLEEAEKVNYTIPTTLI